MPRFCANLTMLYNEVDFLHRFAQIGIVRRNGNLAIGEFHPDAFVSFAG